MTGKQYSVLVALAVVSSLVGGAVSHHLLNGRPTWAAEMDAVTPNPGNITSPTRTMRIQNLELVDDDGDLHARLAIGRHKAPGLFSYNKDGSISLSMELSQKGNSRICLKGKGGAQATLHTGAQGQPGLMLFDKKGKLRAMLRLLSDGSPLFGLQDKEGRSRVALGRITPEASSTPLPDRPVSSLVLFDGKENVIWQAP